MGYLVLIVLIAIIGVGAWSIVSDVSKSNEPTSAKDAIPVLSSLVESNVKKTEMVAKFKVDLSSVKADRFGTMYNEKTGDKYFNVYRVWGQGTVNAMISILELTSTRTTLRMTMLNIKF